MTDTILGSIRELNWVTSDYSNFDAQLSPKINAALMILNQIGIGINGFRVETGEVFHTLVNPKMPLREKTIGITGITEELLQDAMTEAEAMKEFVQFLGEDRILLGHSIAFDHSFLVTAMQRCGYKVPEFFGIDTLKISRSVCSELPSKTLEAMCEHFGIVNERAHRALADVKATIQLYECLKEQGADIAPIPLVFHPKKQEPMTKKQVSFLNAILSYHKLEGKYQTEGMTKSEASRLIDRLLFTYGRILN